MSWIDCLISYIYIRKIWGPRCQDFDRACLTCQKWQEHDQIFGLDKIVVRQPYYKMQCEHCGWLGSSEDCHEIRYDDDADVICPACNNSTCGRAPKERFRGRFVYSSGDF